MKLRRTILKQELAVKLYPDSISPESALQLLRKEINDTPILKEKLYGDSPISRVHYFTHKQLLVLLEHFCITQEEFEMMR